MVGLAAMAAGVAGTQGLVTKGEEFVDVPLVDVDEIVVGGHDISSVPLTKKAQQLADEHVFSAAVAKVVEADLEAVDARIRPGISADIAQREAISLVQRDLREFAESEGCDVVVVVNVASTEPLFALDEVHDSLANLDAALDSGRHVLPASSLYAYAAIDAGFAFVDFTPSTGARVPAIDQLSQERMVPHAGRDGKTGETLVKTTLAPMFVSRNLKVRSWAGLNILGGGDGAALADPARAASKLESKQRSLVETLGYSPQHPVHIDYVEDMGEWKTAWNHISFEGFLGTSMTMQFTWQGCDSTLAAPLVIDLARLTALAIERGEFGMLPALGFFFKDPAGTDDHNVVRQYVRLCEWANSIVSP